MKVLDALLGTIVGVIMVMLAVVMVGLLVGGCATAPTSVDLAAVDECAAALTTSDQQQMTCGDVVCTVVADYRIECVADGSSYGYGFD